MRNVFNLGDNIDLVIDRAPEEIASTNREEIKRLLSGAMDRLLTQRQRKCLSMYYFDEMKMEDIGRALGLHKSTVSRHIAAAKKKLSVLRVMI